MIFCFNASKTIADNIESNYANDLLRNIKHNLKTLKPNAKIDVIYLKIREHNPKLIFVYPNSEFSVNDQNELLFDPNL